MELGKLYEFGGEFIVDVNYRFIDHSESNWWGELFSVDQKQIKDGEGYEIELSDGRRGRCSLRRRINRAVSGVLTVYYYYFRGHGALK